jgi:hypothetical protein
MPHRIWILGFLLVACSPRDSQVTPRDSAAPSAIAQARVTPPQDSGSERTDSLVEPRNPDPPVDSAGKAARRARMEAFRREYDWPLPPPPRIEGYPIIYRNSCIGESCGTERIVIACQDVPLHESASKDSPMSLVLKKGDTATAGQDLHVIAPGIVVIRRDFVRDHDFDDDGRRVPLPDTIRFARGDTVFLLLYGELGTWRAKYRGTELLLSAFWGARPRLERLGGAGTDSTNAVLRSEFYVDTWWPLKLPDGRTGWKLRDHDSDLPLMVYKYPHEPWDWKCKTP